MERIGELLNHMYLITFCRWNWFFLLKENVMERILCWERDVDTRAKLLANELLVFGNS
jgi:hypothetical protein